MNEYLGRKVSEGGNGGHSDEPGHTAGFIGGVFIYVCAGFRGAERRDSEGDGREFVLWIGDWVYSVDGSVCSGEHFRWSIQSGDCRGNLDTWIVGVVEYLDLSCGGVCRRGGSGCCFQDCESRRQVTGSRGGPCAATKIPGRASLVRV
jgi:hypothetical protein